MRRNLHLPTLALAITTFAFAQPRISSVANGAEFTNTLAPASLGTIFGTGLAPGIGSPDRLPFPTSLNGVSVNVNGRPAPLTYVSPTQINFQLPSATNPGTASAVVVNGSQTSAAVNFPVASTAPGIFQYGAGRGVIQNQDYSLNSRENLAAGRSAVIVYLTGIGLTNPSVPDGTASPGGPLAQPPLESRATIGGENARILFLGLTPGNVGLAQANIEIPSLPISGDYPLVIEVGGRRSQPVSVAVEGDPRIGLPEGATCFSGPVESVTLSLDKELSGQADEIVIGGERLCPTCDNKAPVYGPFVGLINKARRARMLVDACYDSFGTVNFVRLRR
jgi:uncharacterized protein (TIGR03437 family)